MIVTSYFNVYDDGRLGYPYKDKEFVHIDNKDVIGRIKISVNLNTKEVQVSDFIE